MIIDCIADLHGYYPQLEGGDLLIIAGDLTAQHRQSEFGQFLSWCGNQKYKKTVLIAGNHDSFLEDFDNGTSFGSVQNPNMHIEYLCDSGTEFEGLKIWGSPWTKTFPGINPHCCAFTVDTDEELAEKWKLIPEGIDILVTHSPSFGNLDLLRNNLSVGSISLWMMTLSVRPKLHVFGHIHESYGYVQHYNGVRLVNASIVNEYYRPVNKPIRIIL